MDAIHCNYHDYGNRNRRFRLFMDYVANVIPFFGRNLTRIYFKLTQSTFAGAPRRFSPCRFRLVGKGLERETLLPFPRLWGFGTHYETGPEFLLLFSIKSKEERLCFAVKVLNGRTTNLHQTFLLFHFVYSSFKSNA